MDYKQLEVSITDRVALVRFVNMPGGFMVDNTVQELTQFVAWADTSDEIGAVVLTGGLQGVFIRHYNVGEICQIHHALKDADLSAMEPQLFAIDNLTLAMEACSKPIAAAINGMCMGGGFETALGCDVRFAQIGPDTRIGFPETSVGILPGGGGTQRLTRLVGPARAAQIILASQVVSAEAAERYGLVNEAVSGDVVEVAMAWARRVASLPDAAVQHCKKLIDMAANEDMPLEQGLLEEGRLFLDLVTRPDVLPLLEAAQDGIETEIYA